MLYRLVRPFATIALKTNFRKIYFSNAQVIPKNKPVILAVNHPTAFLEPCLLACLLPQPLHFMVRGDLFKGNLVLRVFDSLHLIPIYRIQDAGYGGLKNNFKSFEKCYEALSQNKTILILAEGNTIQEKRLRPIQKGTARIAIGALQKYPDLDIQIVPVGVNYTYADQFRSRVMFEFGQPITVQEYFRSHENEPKTAINQITQKLRASLEKHVVIVEDKGDDELAEKLLSINRNDFPDAPRPVVSLNNHLLKSEKTLTGNLNKMTKEDKASLEGKVDDYLARLGRHDLADWAIARQNATANAGWLAVLIGSLPFLLGYAGNFLPAYFSYTIAIKKTKYLEFIASIRTAVAIGAFLLYYTILLILAFAFKNLFFIGFVLILPFMGYFSILYKEYFQKWQQVRKLQKVDKKVIADLKKERESFLNKIKSPSNKQ